MGDKRSIGDNTGGGQGRAVPVIQSIFFGHSNIIIGDLTRLEHNNFLKEKNNRPFVVRSPATTFI
jgi:hypothetical protein